MKKAPLLIVALGLALGLGACGSNPSSGTTTPEPESSGATLDRLRFNQLAVRENIPVFWVADSNQNGQIDPDEVRSLNFYPTRPVWTRDGNFTEAFNAARDRIVRSASQPAPSDERRRLVFEELDSIAPTVLETDLSTLEPAHRAFAERMANVAEMVDRLYARQVGMEALSSQLDVSDTASASLFRRNWGSRCLGATTERNPACSAIDGAPRQLVDVYPASLQANDEFCGPLEARDDSVALLTPFTVVRAGETEGSLVAVPYSEAYAELMGPIAAELRTAAEAMTDPNEDALRAYLAASAQAFEDNNWYAADEAWAAMNARNSQWYIRVGPDETYWDPCSQKAGFHMTLSRIDQGSLEWQDRLTPLQQQMEVSLASLVETYDAREVSFHLPDFIQIVANSGDDRNPFGGTIGQSLPNWGPVSAESRGRTVAMTNLYEDPDSRERRRAIAMSMLTPEAMELHTSDPTPGLLSTILHEATHNLGPSHEYEANGQTDDEAFGGGLASMLEELKAQSGALYFLATLREAGVIDERMQQQAYLNSIVWAFGHISRGMYTASGNRKAYSQLSAIQIGFLMEHDVLAWDAEATAANGEDTGAFRVNFEAMPQATIDLMTLVMRIKSTGDRAEAESVANRYVDGEVVPQAVIVERHRRFPRASFVYAIQM